MTTKIIQSKTILPDPIANFRATLYGEKTQISIRILFSVSSILLSNSTNSI